MKETTFNQQLALEIILPTPEPDVTEWVYTKYITRNGKRVYHPKGKVYRFPAKKT